MPITVLDTETNEVQALPEAEAMEGIRSGRYAVDRRAGPIPVVRQREDGGFEELEVDPENLHRALSSGLMLDSPDAAAERRARREAASASGQAVTALEQAASGAALGTGLAEAAEAALGTAFSDRSYDELRQDIARRAEVNPNAALAGQVAGSVAPLLLSGGTGAAARTAEAIAAPSILAEGVGNAVTRGLAGNAPGLARRILARGGGLFTEGAIEGALQGAGQAVTEDALGDTDHVGESFLATVGTNALLGGAASTVFGGAMEGLGYALSRGGESASAVLRNAWSERTGVEMAPEVAEALSHTLNRGAPRPGEVPPLRFETPEELVRALGTGGPGSRRVRDVLAAGDSIYEDGAREIRRDLDSLIQRSTHVEDFAVGSLKREAVASRIDGSRLDDQFARAATQLDGARELAQRLQSDPVFDRIGVARGRELMQQVDNISAEIEQAIGRGSANDVSAQLYTRLDQLKRNVGRLQRTAGHRDPEAARALQGLYDQMIAPLEDASLWGESVATMQREVNSAWHRYLGRASEFDSMFTARGVPDDEVNPFRMLREADPAQIVGFLRNSGRAANDRRAEIFRDVLESRQQLSEAIAQHMDVPAELASEVASAPQEIARIRQTLERAESSARIANQWREASAELAPSRGMIGALTGGLYAGAPGALVGAVGPQQAVRALSLLDRFRAGTDERITNGVRRFLGKAARATSDVTAGVRDAMPSVGRAARRAAVQVATTYDERVKQLDEQSRDIAATTRRIGEASGRIARHAPRTADAVSTTASRAATFLQSRRPRQPPAPLLPGMPQRQPTKLEKERFMRYARGVDDPLAIVDDLASGEATREGVEALQAVYPKLYQRVRQAVMEELAESETAIPYAKRLQLSILLGAPTDPSLEPDFIATIQAGYQGPSQQPPSAASSSRAPQLAASVASDMDAFEARRAGRA